MATKIINISGMTAGMSKSISAARKKEHKSVILPLADKRIGISVSESDEYEQMGFSKMHQKDITTELTRYLLVNGAHLVYGGDLRNEGYTYAFSELSFQYRKKEEHDKMHYTNYFGWPIYNILENSDLADFKKNRVNIVCVPPPKDTPRNLLNKKELPDNIENKMLFARSMSAMRNKMISETNARIFIGGKLSVYKGFYPGIIEEGILTLRAQQPLFLIGAFAGATNLMIRAIKGEDEKKLAKEIFDWYPGLEALYSYAGKKEMTEKLQNIFAEFKRSGIAGLSKLNGLSKEENNILFDTTLFHEMIKYVLVGLKRKYNK